MPRRKLLDLTAVTADMDEGLREFVAAPVGSGEMPDDVYDGTEPWEIPIEVVEANPRIETSADGRPEFRFNGDGRDSRTALVATGAYELETPDDRLVTPQVLVHQEFDALDPDLLQDEQSARAEIARFISGTTVRRPALRPSQILQRLYAPRRDFDDDDEDDEVPDRRPLEAEAVRTVREFVDSPPWTTPARLELLRNSPVLPDGTAFLQTPGVDRLLAQGVTYHPQITRDIRGVDRQVSVTVTMYRLIGFEERVREFVRQMQDVTRVADNQLRVSFGTAQRPWFVINFLQAVLISSGPAVSVASPTTENPQQRLTIVENLSFMCIRQEILELRPQDTEPGAEPCPPVV